jgi:hypothetical protein
MKLRSLSIPSASSPPLPSSSAPKAPSVLEATNQGDTFVSTTPKAISNRNGATIVPRLISFPLNPNSTSFMKPLIDREMETLIAMPSKRSELSWNWNYLNDINRSLTLPVQAFQNVVEELFGKDKKSDDGLRLLVKVLNLGDPTLDRGIEERLKQQIQTILSEKPSLKSNFKRIVDTLKSTNNNPSLIDNPTELFLALHPELATQLRAEGSAMGIIIQSFKHPAKKLQEILVKRTGLSLDHFQPERNICLTDLDLIV